MTCAQAIWSKLSVVIFAGGALEGDAGSMSLDAMTLDVSGDSSVALVALGSANRVMGCLWGCFRSAGLAMALAALGVGVHGGAGAACWVRLIGGVAGWHGAVGSGEDAFRFRLYSVFLGGGAGHACGHAGSARVLRRVERRVAATVEFTASGCLLGALDMRDLSEEDTEAMLRRSFIRW